MPTLGCRKFTKKPINRQIAGAYHNKYIIDRDFGARTTNSSTHLERVRLVVFATEQSNDGANIRSISRNIQVDIVQLLNILKPAIDTKIKLAKNAVQGCKHIFAVFLDRCSKLQRPGRDRRHGKYICEVAGVRPFDIDLKPGSAWREQIINPDRATKRDFTNVAGYLDRHVLKGQQVLNRPCRLLEM